MINKEKQNNISLISEELTKADIRSMIDSELDDFLKEQGLRKKIREICVDVLDDFFKEMWRKNGFWKNAVKNG